MKKVLLSAFIMAGLILSTSTSLWAGELDILLEKLVDKGILTPVEATIIKDETAAQVTKELSQQKSYAVPGWVQKIKFKGDLRARYQYEKKEQSSSPRHRERVRARLAMIAKLYDDLRVGIGIASGGDDPRSTNETLDDTFSSKSIALDLAYFEWDTPIKGLMLTGGKFKRKPVLWAPTDLLWDGDINPEGASVNYQTSLLDNVDMWINGGIWSIDELSSERDPYMKYVQLGLKGKEGIVDGKFAFTYYLPENVNGNTLEHSAESNTGATTELVSDYDSIALGTEIGFKKPFGGLPYNIDERIAFFGEFVQNLDDTVLDDSTHDLTGHAFGFKLGHKKVKKPGSWQFKYIKAKLGKDAWLDTFPDSDRFGGATGIESHEAVFKYALRKNVTLGLDYYKSWDQTAEDNKERIVQADVAFKF